MNFNKRESYVAKETIEIKHSLAKLYSEPNNISFLIIPKCLFAKKNMILEINTFEG